MTSATEEGRKPSGKCGGISHCLESGHPVNPACWCWSDPVHKCCQSW